jgi:CheY-like chemotaxis protein
MLLRGRKLLLADDSIAIQKVIELTFGDEGMQVVSVGDGRQAVERLAEVRPDIVLADVFMPELNGYQVCEQIKRDERFREIPVILLVGSFEPFNDAEARRVGADDYLTKPFQSIRQMVSKVGSLLSGHKSEEAATQKLPAPPEPSQPESPGRRDNLEFTTADTAPLPHHMRPEDTDSAAPPKGPFADLQLDDEMIEETPANEFGFAGQKMAASHQRPTESLSSQDFADMGINATAAASPSVAGGQAQRADEAREPREAVETREPPSTPAHNAAASASSSKSDNALLDLDDVELPRSSAMAEADDFILDLQDTNEPQQRAASSADDILESFESSGASTPEGSGAGEAEQLAEAMAVSAPQAAEFVEAERIGEKQRAELAPAEEWQAEVVESPSYQEHGSASTAEVAPEMQPVADSSQMQGTHELVSAPPTVPTQERPEHFQPEARPLQAEAASSDSKTPAAGTQPQAGQIELAQLSAEAIDAIARRVVEQLSTKVIEQIAWEVVPQLAELLIKRRLEEEGK